MNEITTDSKNKKKALGRGLGSLLGGASSEDKTDSQRHEAQPIKTSIEKTNSAPEMQVSPEGKIWQISIEKIKAGPYQPRKAFEKDTLEELAQSIRQNGILQPIVVRKSASGSFEIVAGERRWRAAQMAGLHDVPVIIKNFSDKETLELAIIENIQREDLNPIEEAEAYSRLVAEFSLSQQEVADRVGKDRVTVANLLRVLTLPSEVKKYIEDNLLSLGHAKVLLASTTPQKQIELAKKSIGERWSVRKLEKEIQSQQKKNLAPTLQLNSGTDPSVTARLIQGLSEELQKLLGTKVAIDYTSGKGRISISFYSDEELSSLVDKLKVGCSK